MQKITIIVGKTGEVAIATSGFQGAACLAATKPLEDALGGLLDRKLKPEYYAQAGAAAEVDIQTGAT